MKVLLVPRLKIQNANGLSSPYTIGFPAMTGWLGAVHALERMLADTEFDYVRFKSVGVVCHKMDLQTHRGDGDFVYSIIGTGNPLIPKTKEGDPQNAERPPFVEEARCHLTVSLVIECEGLGLGLHRFEESVDKLVQGRLKMAGGDILSAKPVEVKTVDNEKSRWQLLRRLMPGFCLIERRDLMIKAMQDGLDGLDALLDHLAVHHTATEDEDGKVSWESKRREKGWLVPIATGFHGISPLGQVKNQRAPETPHCFAESVVTLGEFVMPYRIEDLNHMLWHYHSDLENNLYLCKPNTAINEL